MDREAFKTQLLLEIEKTEQKITEYREWTKPVSPDDAIGRLSRMDAINNKSVTESALRQAEEKLRRLYFVTTRLDSADFGRCVKCQQAIPPGRLLIKPESIHCVRCAR